MSLSVSIILDTRREKQAGKYPLKLRSIYNRTTRDYPTIYDLTPEEYKKFVAPRISNELMIIRENVQSIEKDAYVFATNLKPFSHEKFEEQFINPSTFFRKKRNKKTPLPSSPVKVSNSLDLPKYEKLFPILKETSKDAEYISATFISYITNLLHEDRIGTALSYQAAYFSFKSFEGDIPFSCVDKSYLTRFEQWMVNKKGCSIATVGGQARAMRVMFNEAIEGAKIISRDAYPFGKRKYRIPSKRSGIVALKQQELEIIFNYTPEEYSLQRAKAYWFFCYLGNGMNPSDMAHLKFRDIKGDFISFVRNKTRWTTRENPKIISVYMNEEIKEIIDVWGNDPANLEDYIFPILNNDMSLLEKYSRVRTLTKYLNDSMTEIVNALQIEKKINNKICRKSLATGLKRAGASTEFIQDTMGHMSKNTTEIYLEDYEDDVKKNFSLLISSFKKKEVI